MIILLWKTAGEPQLNYKKWREESWLSNGRCGLATHVVFCKKLNPNWAVDDDFVAAQPRNDLPDDWAMEDDLVVEKGREIRLQALGRCKARTHVPPKGVAS